MKANEPSRGMTCAFCGMALNRFADVWMSPKGVIGCADAVGCRRRQNEAERARREARGMDPPR